MSPDGESPADPFDAGPFTRLQAFLRFPPPCAAEASARRAAVAAALAWLPLAALSALEGHAPGASSHAAFLLDGSVHVQFLVTLPLLIAAEAWCLPRLAAIGRNFASSGLIAGDDLAALREVATRVRRSLDHRGVEVVLAGLAYGGAILLSGRVYRNGVPTWMAPDGNALSAAGWWRTMVSQPLLLVMTAAWLWRVGVWTRFLAGVAGLRLRLVPAHPDLAGGLGFLGISLRAFAPVALALGAAAAGAALRRGAGPPSLEHLAVVVGIIVLLFTAPLLVFAGPLHRARMRGILEYGALASALGRAFEARWIRTDAAPDAEALSASDFSATTDLYSIAANAWRMSVVPVGLRDLAVLLAVTLLPMVPLLLFFMPVNEILRTLAGLIL